MTSKRFFAERSGASVPATESTTPTFSDQFARCLGSADKAPALRLFGPAREIAGVAATTFDARTVGAVLDDAVEAWGPQFATLLERCQVWVNGEVASRSKAVGPNDEMAIIPPVSGGTD